MSDIYLMQIEFELTTMRCNYNIYKIAFYYGRIKAHVNSLVSVGCFEVKGLWVHGSFFSSKVLLYMYHFI